MFRQIRTSGSVYERLRVSPTDPAVVIADGPKSPQTGSKDDALMIRVSCWPMGLKPKGILGGAAYVSEFRLGPLEGEFQATSVGKLEPL